jgi:hypothetical protein
MNQDSFKVHILNVSSGLGSKWDHELRQFYSAHTHSQLWVRSKLEHESRQDQDSFTVHYELPKLWIRCKLVT